ncbi:MAG: DUF222 domain-containing protein, partial [Actinobacteria bacterium]|nr:DUF222 domain-containing protein [Actinomycetota bacterium]
MAAVMPNESESSAGAPTPDALEQMLGQLHAMECAVRAEFLKTAASYVASKAWLSDGARDLAEWLVGRFAISPYQARELARVADAVVCLPKLLSAFAEGRISWDQLRVVTKYATPDTDERLAEQVPGLSLRSIEAKARAARTMSAAEAKRQHDDQFLLLYRRGEDRLRIRGELVGEWAAVVEKALLRRLEAQPKPPEGEDPLPYDVRLASALHELCSGAIGADPDPDRATVVVHTDLHALHAHDGVADIEGLLISSETVRRLCCDGRIQEVLEIGGIPIGIGTTSRTVPFHLRRLLTERDQGCRFPGCSRRRWVHAHHMWHWEDGGPTDLGNLVLLCSYHHHFLHEGGWKIRGNP